MKSIWDEMMRMQEEMDELFSSLTNRPRKNVLLDSHNKEVQNYTRRPLTNIEEKDNSYIVTSELPGVEKKDIEINVKENTLEINVNQKHEKETKEKGLTQYQRTCRGFYRQLPLPKNANIKDCKASYENGVLQITFPKKEPSADEVKKITVE